MQLLGLTATVCEGGAAEVVREDGAQTAGWPALSCRGHTTPLPCHDLSARPAPSRLISPTRTGASMWFPLKCPEHKSLSQRLQGLLLPRWGMSQTNETAVPTELPGSITPAVATETWSENRPRAPDLWGICPSGNWARWLPKGGGARGCFQKTLLRKANKKKWMSEVNRKNGRNRDE